jgi:hypothetical protein
MLGAPEEFEATAISTLPAVTVAETESVVVWPELPKAWTRVTAPAGPLVYGLHRIGGTAADRAAGAHVV